MVQPRITSHAEAEIGGKLFFILEARAKELVRRTYRALRIGEVVPERKGEAHAAVLHLAVPAKIETMKLGVEEVLELSVGHGAQVVVATKGEETKGVIARDIVVDSRLIVPIVEAHLVPGNRGYRRE